MSDERFREDELVSAYLDNEATPAEVAEVERDATLLARVEQLRSVRDAVAAPVPPAPSAQREQAISAALGVADAEAAARLEAKIVPVHQPQRLLLALAAAVILLAAVVGGGLIASRGGDDALEMASEAPTMADAAADAEMAAGAAEEPTAELDMETVDDAMPADEAMPEQEPMAEEAMEEPAEYAEAEEPEPAPTAPSPTTTIAVSAADDGEAAAAEAAAAEEVAAAEPETDDPRDTEYTSGDSSAEVSDTASQAVDLGTLDDLETFLHGVARHWQAQDADDAALTKPGECSASLQDRVLELNGEVLQSFVAIVGVEDPVTINAELARRDDGTAFIVYAAGPDCETEIQELAELPAP